MRSAKNATLVTLATAMTSAAARILRPRASRAPACARTASLHDLPGGEAHYAAAAARERLVVRDQHQRGAVFAVHLEQQVDHAAAGRRVEAAGRLVGEQHLGPHHEGA